MIRIFGFLLVFFSIFMGSGEAMVALADIPAHSPLETGEIYLLLARHSAPSMLDILWTCPVWLVMGILGTGVLLFTRPMRPLRLPRELF